MFLQRALTVTETTRIASDAWQDECVGEKPEGVRVDSVRIRVMGGHLWKILNGNRTGQ